MLRTVLKMLIHYMAHLWTQSLGPAVSIRAMVLAEKYCGQTNNLSEVSRSFHSLKWHICQIHWCDPEPYLLERLRLTASNLPLCIVQRLRLSLFLAYQQVKCFQDVLFSSYLARFSHYLRARSCRPGRTLSAQCSR